MKKSLLIASLFTALAFNKASAQILNGSFENWKLDTFVLAPGVISTLPADTVTYFDPVDWTSSNTLTALDSLGGRILVTQSSTAVYGTSAIQLKTDSIKLPVIPNFPALKVIIPGFALNGTFPISPNSLITSGNVISPVSLLGAGQPYTQRLGKIKGYFNYAPAFNTNTNANDTCVIWATLRKGTTAIADAIFKSTSSTGGYQPFEASFDYHSCDMPDTLVILLASSVPNVQTILGGNSGLVPGSTLLVDSIWYEDLPGNYDFAPIARPDLDTAYENTPKNILVKLNDEDCDNPTLGLTVTVSTQPANGTTSVTAGLVTYTPANNFTGVDTFRYTLSDGTLSSIAKVTVYVFPSTGISETNEIPVSVYPVPASDMLNIQFENVSKTTLRVFDVTGKLVLTSILNKNNNSVSVAELTNGVYGLQLTGENNSVISRSKFTVNR